MFQLFLLAVYASFTCAKTVNYDFSIGWVTVCNLNIGKTLTHTDFTQAAPDGFSRPVIGVNGQWP
jgi:hypothetical protein